MARIDKTQEMSSEQIKKTLTNLINKQATKVASEGKYDRTILAKIQYCSDAALGQYKVKYQDGYYTAYALDKTIKYNDGALVYVTVPGNDLSNRLFIQDLASNDSSQKTYLTNLEGDQQYVVSGPNFIDIIADESLLNLSSYWDMTPGREVFYYDYNNQGADASKNIINLINVGEMTHAIKNSDGLIRFGADFKTDLKDSRKTQGNYGIRLVLVFERTDELSGEVTEYTQTYQLDTFRMDGTPFDFIDYAPRYEYWEIDKDNFKRIQSISGFVTGFPQMQQGETPDIDIFIKNITIHAALKIYDSAANDDYVVKILSPKGSIFGLDDNITELPFEAHFMIRGNEVSDQENVQFYWAKQNLSVNSPGHCKYSEYFREGWQCLNQGELTAPPNENPTIEQLKNDIIEMDDFITSYTGIIKWVSTSNIAFPKKLCVGRQTVIKCCAVYQNRAYYSREYTITNINGYYVLLKSSNGTQFYRGNGYTSISAGVFKTEIVGSGDQATYAPTPASKTLDANISYSWELINNNIVTPLPPVNAETKYKSQPDWTHNTVQGLPGQDSVEASNSDSNAFLQALSNTTGIALTLLKCCSQRYKYYNDFINTFQGENLQDERLIRAKERKANIETTWQTYLNSLYVEDYQNEMGLCIMGDSNMTAKYTSLTPEQLKNLYDSNIDPLETGSNAVVVDGITFNYGQTTHNNTIYNFKIADIQGQALFRVTAYITQNGYTEALETKEIGISNTMGAGVKYNLEIVNGKQTFVYDAGGIAPTQRSGATVAIRPLTYRLYDEDGALVLDSDSDNSESIIKNTTPKWTFYRTSTLITTKYSADLSSQYSLDTAIPGRAILANAAAFYYDIAAEYNVNYKERSNIELSIVYAGETYNASTDFTFTKQGELGTNDTNLFLDIEDPIYEQYRSDILTNKMYSRFKDASGAEIMYSPNERHLKNTYMYATKIFTNMNGQLSPVTNFDEGDFCNLRFANKVIVNDAIIPTNPMHFGVQGSTTTTLYAYWYENSSHTIIEPGSWYASGGEHKDVQDQTKYGRSRIYDRASFQFRGNQRSSSNIQIELTPPVDIDESSGIDRGAAVYYKPFGITHMEQQKEYQWTANNVVQCTASKILNAQNPDSELKQSIVRKNYGYYQIPFFYYAHYTNQNGTLINDTPETLDPARHFVITGGYDQVLYGADGFNPQYNAQEPFTFHLFDTQGIDITQQALNSNKITVTWDAAYGFQCEPISRGSAPDYSTYQANINLSNKYCTYENKIYRCIKSHTPNQYVAIRDDATGEIIKEYNKNTTEESGYDFITPYWEEINQNVFIQSRQLTPPPSYDAAATNTLFNSWISVKVIYDINTEKIEAAALIPINVLCNIYGSDELNNWDGKKTKVEDGYIITQKAAAGVKTDDGAFVGIALGKQMMTDGSGKQEVGLFGYGKYYDSSIGRAGYGQTLFLDANTGLAAFGPRGSTQIILNPKIPARDSGKDESWSRLGGWYFSSNYLYKPLWADDNYQEGNDYNTNPPDAEGVNVPGSVGLYVPGSERAGKITSNTVFLWASALGVSSSTFDDDGSLSALQNLVQSIKVLMNGNGFPLYYRLTTEVKQVLPEITINSTIKNYTLLESIYGDDEDIHEALVQYKNIWMTVITDTLRTGGETLALYNSLISKVREITDICNLQDFPTVVRDGSSVLPVFYDNITIENVDSLYYWYVNSAEPTVTMKTDIIADLDNRLHQYSNKYLDFLHAVYRTGSLDLTELARKYQTLKSLINSKGVRNKAVTIWDGSNPVVGIYNNDKVTIDNIDELTTYYLRPAVSASQVARDKLDTLHEKFANYNELHNRYEAWVDEFSNNGKAVTYNSSNNDKLQSNFYVTYGGKMKCTNAEITGKIEALSGHIGKGEKALDIATYRYDPLTGKTQFYLLYNDVFKVKGQDTNTTPSVYIDGTIMARSGQIGNVRENIDGENKHTVFIEYNWYPRKLPPDDARWGDTDWEDVNYRKPVWDETQGKKVKYALWHPYFSIIDSPGGCVNYDTDGVHTDFKYKAGDAAFIGRIYATGGRIGDWVSDQKHNMFRDPYGSIKLKPVLSNNLKSGYIVCGNTVFYGDGSIDGACSNSGDLTHLPSGRTWWITASGEAHFTNKNSTFVCQEIKIGEGTTINNNGWDLPAGAVVHWGDETLRIGESGFNFSSGCTFNGNVNIHGNNSLTLSTVTINRQGFHISPEINITTDTSTLNKVTINGYTEIKGQLKCTNNMTGTNITCNNLTVNTSIRLGNQSLQQYIENVVNNKIRDILGGKAYTTSGPTEGVQHTHTISF